MHVLRKEYEKYADRMISFRLSTNSFPDLSNEFVAEKNDGTPIFSFFKYRGVVKKITATDEDWASLIELLKRYGVFGWKKKYPSDCLDGLDCELEILFPNGKIRSYFHNNYPAWFDDFVNDLESLFEIEHRKFRYC